MNEQIIQALKQLNIPTFYGWYDDSIQDTHITFFSYSDNDTGFEDDENTAIDLYYQIDIWSFENIEELKKKVKKALKDIGFVYIAGNDDFEQKNNKRLYHKAMKFYIEVQADRLWHK